MNCAHLPDPTCAPPVAWRGGQIQHDIRVYLVLWGGGWNVDSSGLAQAVTSFLQNVGGSSYNGLLAQYHDDQHMIHNTSYEFAGSWTDPVPAASAVTPQMAINEANNARNSNNWSNSYDTQYIVLGQTGIANGVSGTCGWHTYGPSNDPIHSNDTYVPSFIPYQWDPAQSSCVSGLASGVPLRAETMVASHEYAEAATDPNAVNGVCGQNGCDHQGEIGDLCVNYGATAGGPGNQYVAMLWDDINNGCDLATNPVYSYQWLSQTYPQLPYSEANGHSYSAGLAIANRGNIAWEAGSGGVVRLGPSNPRDRCSGFFDPGSWLGCGRIALSYNATTSNGSVVLPGQAAAFNFNFHPATWLGAATYREYFDPVADRFTWMSTNAIYWDNPVGSFGAQYVGQQDAPAPLLPTQRYAQSVTFRNTGTVPWFPYELVRLGTSNPQNRTSSFQDSSWPSATRPANVTSEVDPGQSYTFTYYTSIPALQNPGTYAEYFDPVVDGMQWFSTNYHATLVVA